MTGRVLSHYRIVARIADGPAGAAYTAEDLRLKRTVVLRLLPKPARTDDHAAVLAEAKAASALNHPHIAAVYDIDQSDDTDFIAVEYVRGKPLGEAIPRRGMEVSAALKYGIQICDALAAAHADGMVHRDLKPDNIMISESGLAKVLDFGLSKLSEPLRVTPARRRDPASSDGTTGERNAARGNHTTYLAPEQAEGRKGDRRSDIFSFGAILYEMLSGRPAFSGETEADALAAAAGSSPKPLRELVVGIPAEIERMVNRCLRKDPNRRFQLAEDLKLTLEELLEEWDAGTLTPTVPATPVRGPAAPGRRNWWVVASLLVAAGVLYPAWRWARLRLAPTKAPFKLVQLTRDSGVTETPALSPDGRLVAYASDRENGENLDLWVQHIDGGGAVRLTSHPAADHSPSFSPDATQIAFYSERDGGGVYVVPALGGEARLIAKGGRLPRFSPDGGNIAYYQSPQGGITGSQLFVVTVDGAVNTPLQAGFAAAAVPVWTPAGDGLLFFGIHPTEGGDVWMTSLDGKRLVRTGAGAILQKQGVEIKTLDALSATGDALYFTGSFGDSTNIWRLPIEPGSWRVTEPAERLTSGAAEMHSSLSRLGRVVFTAASRGSRVYTIPVDGAANVRGELSGFTAGGAQDTSCDISADGRVVVFRSNKSGNIDIWVREVKSARERPLTSSPEAESMPRLSADGQRVAYSVMRDGKRVLYTVPVRGGAPEELCEDCGPPAGWSRDGARILYTRIVDYRPQIHSIDVATRIRRPVLVHPKLPLYGGRVSPDNQWFSFKADLDVARTAVFVAPLEETGATPEARWVRVTEGSSWDDLPRWGPGGDILYFTSDRDGFRCIWARRLDPVSKEPKGVPFPIVHLHQMQLSMSNLSLAEFELASGLGRLVFPMAELRGNVWLLEPGEPGASQ
jgi:Tol biopolymer transport system component